MQESRLFRQLGFPSLTAYADATFHYARTQVFEFLRVSKAFVICRASPELSSSENLPGRSPRSSRVSRIESTRESGSNSSGSTRGSRRGELRDARAKHRAYPRKDGYGLPGLPVKLSFELSPEDHAVVARGLEKVASEMGDSLEGTRPAPVEALVYLLRRVLETEESVTRGTGGAPGIALRGCFSPMSRLPASSSRD
jgi:hypothetical protein